MTTTITVRDTREDYTDVTLSEGGFEAKSLTDAEDFAAGLQKLLRKHCVIDDVEVATRDEEAL